jgi:hypothetical protein
VSGFSRRISADIFRDLRTAEITGTLQAALK